MEKTTFSFLLFFVIHLGTASCNKLSAQKENDSLQYYYDISSNSNSTSDLIKAYKFYDRNKEFNLTKHDTIEAIQSLRHTVSVQKKLGVFYDAKTTIVEGLKLLNNLKESRVKDDAKIGLYNDLGIIYRRLYDYKKALEYYNKALNLASSSPNYKNIILNNMAIIFKEQKEYDKAIKTFEAVYQNSLLINKEKQIARSLSNLGLVKSKNNHPEALSNLSEALAIRKKINYLPGIMTSYLHLTEYYKDRNYRTKALFYANQVLEMSKVQKNIIYELDALSFLVELKEDKNIINYKKLKDSIVMANQIKENKFASRKYDYTQAILKAKESELKSEREKSSRIIFQSIGVIISITSIALFFILKIRHKKEKLQQVYNTETRISRKVHDEVANDLYHVMNKLQNLSNDSSILNDLDSIYNKTRDISKENSALEVEDNFKDILNDLVLSYNNQQVSIITKNILSINWNGFSKTKKIIIYRLIQELMTNMKKHSQASLVNLSFKQSNKKLSILYNDNGIGCDIKKGNGLLNMENRIKSINGKITFDSKPQKGFKIIIEV